MGLGAAAGAQIQDDVKRTGALHRDQEIPASTVHRHRNSDLGRDRPIKSLPVRGCQSLRVAVSACIRDNARPSSNCKIGHVCRHAISLASVIRRAAWCIFIKN